MTGGAALAGRHLRRRAAGQGFTVTELAVSLAILAVAMLLVSGLIVGISSQTSAERFSVQALSQTQLAGGTLVQYLRGATEILPASPSAATAPAVASASTGAQDLTVVANEGYSTATYTSYSTVICAQWNAAPSPGADSQFNVIFDCGTSGQHTVATYFALASQTQPVFTYEKWTSAGLTPLTEPIPACAYGEIVAVKLHVTFLAGPQKPDALYVADEATTLDTTVFLQGDGLAGTGGSTTTTTSTATPCSE